MSAVPRKPTSSEATTRFPGRRQSAMASSRATQRGVVAIRIAASPLDTRCSATTTKALPKVHKSTPDSTSVGSSRRVGRMRTPRTRAQSKSTGKAKSERAADIAYGGKPAPGRTATRMAR